MVFGRPEGLGNLERHRARAGRKDFYAGLGQIALHQGVRGFGPARRQSDPGRAEVLQGRDMRLKVRVARNSGFALGFREYLRPEYQSDIITSYLYPDKNFDFEKFYQSLADRGFVIYPGKVSNAECFRIGTIGRIYPADVSNLVEAIRDVLKAASDPGRGYTLGRSN